MISPATAHDPRSREAGEAPPHALAVNDLWVELDGSEPAHPIVRGVDLHVAPGEAHALVGESGSGKSMLARAVMQLLAGNLRMSGSVRVHGRETVGLREAELAQLRGREVAMVFQDPFTMLNPTMRCGDQIVELLRDDAGRPLRGEQRREEVRRRLAEVGIDDPQVARAYPGELSGGMRQRIGIAAALALDPQVVIADEPTTALDVTTQREILRLLMALQRSRGMALVLITHDLRVAFSVCGRASVMYAGVIVESGSTDEIAHRPRHPYTRALLDSEPPADRRLQHIEAIPGTPARAHEHLSSCAFAPRCAWAITQCTRELPRSMPIGTADTMVACTRAPQLRLARDVTAASPPELAEQPAQSERRPVVEVRDLHKSYRSGRREVVALEGVDLTVLPGESVGIVGESGSGKSTLARCLVGLEQADAGAIRVTDHDVTDFRALGRRGRQQVRSEIQMVFQDPNSTLNPALTVGATIREAIRLQETRVRTTPGELMTLVGLVEDHLPRRPHELSGGQRQRVSIARALAVEPRVLVCDEAVSALDVSVQAQVLNVLNELRATLGISLLFITHDLAVVRQVTDRVYVMHHGSVVESGPTGTVLDDPQDPYSAALMSAAPRLAAGWLEDR